jgi:hypothetical protein
MHSPGMSENGGYPQMDPNAHLNRKNSEKWIIKHDGHPLDLGVPNFQTNPTIWDDMFQLDMLSHLHMDFNSPREPQNIIFNHPSWYSDTQWPGLFPYHPKSSVSKCYPPAISSGSGVQCSMAEIIVISRIWQSQSHKPCPIFLYHGWDCNDPQRNG